MTTKKKCQDNLPDIQPDKLGQYKPRHKGINTALGLTKDEELPAYNPKGAGCPQKNKQVPMVTILKLANRGLSDGEAAKILGCSRQNVSTRLSPYRHQIAALPDYQKRELDLIDLAKQGILDELIRRICDPETHLKKMTIPQLAMTFGILTDKGQAIKGKAPAAASNLSVNIVFDPSMLPQSDGAKHLEKIKDSFTVDVDGKIDITNGAGTDGKPS